MSLKVWIWKYISHDNVEMTLIKEISLNLFLGKYFLLKVSTEIQHVRNLHRWWWIIFDKWFSGRMNIFCGLFFAEESSEMYCRRSDKLEFIFS